MTGVAEGEAGEAFGSADDVESGGGDGDGGRVVAVEEVDVGEDAVAKQRVRGRVEAVLIASSMMSVSGP